MWPFEQWIEQYKASTPDSVTKNWFLLNSDPVPVWVLSALYLTIVVLGPKAMANRTPFNVPRSFIIFYNFSLVALSGYMFLEIVFSAWGAGYTTKLPLCWPFDKDTTKNPKELRVSKVLWWYFFSKTIEFMDTILMVLRKKNNQITFLHVFHHVSMLNIWWWVMMFIPAGCSIFGAVVNCLVHVVMYAYYGLSAFPSMKGKLWWKRYITTFQLLQFCITFSHSLYSIYSGCAFPEWGKWLVTGYMVILLGLFMNFYSHTYLGRPKNAAKRASHNGSTGNGSVTNKIMNGAGVNNYQNGFATSKRD